MKIFKNFLSNCVRFFALGGHYFVYELSDNILNTEETNSKMPASLHEHSLIAYMLYIKMNILSSLKF